MADTMDLLQLKVASMIAVTVTVLLVAYFWLSRRNPKYPPCPLRAWPIVGNLLQLNPDPREQFAGFRGQYGDIYSLYLGSSSVVILNGFDVVKEALVKQADDFSDRALLYIDTATDGVNKGIASSSGDVWKEHRATFSAVVLRNLGNKVLADKIQEEVNHLVELLDSFKGNPKNIQAFITTSLTNIICSIVLGQRYEYDDKEFHRIRQIINFNVAKIKETILLNFIPCLRYLPGDVFYFKTIVRNVCELFDIFAKAHIKENEDTVGEPGNFIAAYIQEMKRKEAAGEKTYLDKPNLMKTILDVLFVGTNSPAITLAWFFLYMVNYPDVQEKVFQEINEVVGLDRTPVMQDKAKLTYTMATIMEVQRLAVLLPLGIPRVVSRDVSLRGYLIPKGTEIIVNFDSILHDTSLWGDDADTFRPERFIAEDGSLLSPETWIPFSLGRRVCAGETVAKMEMFVFVSNILQRFQILPAGSKTIPPVKGYLGLTHNPLPYEIRLVNRRSCS